MGVIITFEVEEIPDEDHLYLRVHKNKLLEDKKTIPTTAFNQVGDSLSTLWSRYVKTADEARKKHIIVLPRIIQLLVL